MTSSTGWPTNRYRHTPNGPVRMRVSATSYGRSGCEPVSRADHRRIGRSPHSRTQNFVRRTTAKEFFEGSSAWPLKTLDTAEQVLSKSQQVAMRLELTE